MSEDRLRAAVALYDRFTHEGMDRRLFMAQLTRIAGGTAAASVLLSGIAADAQAAPQIAADDPRIRSFGQSWSVTGGRFMDGYSVMPRGVSGAPCVIIIHENRGLTEHIRDVARRFALAGYYALALDFLSTADPPPATEDEARSRIGTLDLEVATADAVATVNWFSRLDGRTRPVGVVGFCWGGAMVNRLAVAAGEALTAGVSFYGPAPDPAEAARVRAAMLIILAGLDNRVNATGRPWAEALRAAGKTVELREFPNVDHAFHNDTSAARYNPQAAQAAWAATLDFFRRHLR